MSVVVTRSTAGSPAEGKGPMKRLIITFLVVTMAFFSAGCGLINTALAVGAAYGLSRVFDK
jgi:hypothetical protein